MTNYDIYQIKVTLNGSKPPIWRRIQVPGNIRLNKLHLILQATMGWWNAHLHQYIVNETYYGEPHPDYDMWGRKCWMSRNTASTKLHLAKSLNLCMNMTLATVGSMSYW